ncbi:hypothetical protein GA0061102_105521 [Rhizobium miluonense]|uniref:Uncharacterized protein n=2 Tax=Rhizobium/Agrobacterium group TaxID=227290 RepID=A0A1C3X3J6_9HYPH|nr:hypothetical protein GA0061102_105521 [Rhizobium miluonense]
MMADGSTFFRLGCLLMREAGAMMKTLFLAFLATTVSCTTAFASGTIYYGSRAGMEVTIVNMSGLDTSHAEIRTKHTRENAVAFCREYVQKVTPDCIKQELATPLNDLIQADCKTGVFTDFVGDRHQFQGRNPAAGSMAKYRLVDLKTNEAADGSSASGYSTNMGIFRALCPRTAPQDD